MSRFEGNWVSSFVLFWSFEITVISHFVYTELFKERKVIRQHLPMLGFNNVFQSNAGQEVWLIPLISFTFRPDNKRLEIEPFQRSRKTKNAAFEQKQATDKRISSVVSSKGTIVSIMTCFWNTLVVRMLEESIFAFFFLRITIQRTNEIDAEKKVGTKSATYEQINK